MRARLLYSVAGILFLVAAVMEVRPPRATTATVLDLVAAVIFLFLGFGPQPRRRPPAPKS